MTDNQPTCVGSAKQQSLDPELVLDDPAVALASLDATLPSLRLEPAPIWVETGVAPLIDLGRCNVQTAQRIASALRAGAGTLAGASTVVTESPVTHLD